VAGRESSTRICSFRLEPDGYVRATMHDGVTFELADAMEAVAVTWQVAGERPRGVLVDMRGLRSQSREAREYFVSDEAARRMTAVALLVGSPVSRIVGSFFLRMGTHRVPTRLFSDETAAERWLMEQHA
jgi:hypothetical protein